MDTLLLQIVTEIDGQVAPAEFDSHVDADRPESLVNAEIVEDAAPN